VQGLAVPEPITGHHLSDGLTRNVYDCIQHADSRHGHCTLISSRGYVSERPHERVKLILEWRYSLVTRWNDRPGAPDP